MEKNINETNEIQIELTEEVSNGVYANLAIVAHSSSDFVIDFIRLLPGVTKPKVLNRIILTPDNAKRLLSALEENISKYDKMCNGGDGLTYLPPIGGFRGEA